MSPFLLNLVWVALCPCDQKKLAQVTTSGVGAGVPDLGRGLTDSDPRTSRCTPSSLVARHRRPVSAAQWFGPPFSKGAHNGIHWELGRNGESPPAPDLQNWSHFIRFLVPAGGSARDPSPPIPAVLAHLPPAP